MTMPDHPTPFRLTFAGDIRGSDIRERTLGPNTVGEFFRAVRLDYDAEADKTVVHCEIVGRDRNA